MRTLPFAKAPEYPPGLRDEFAGRIAQILTQAHTVDSLENPDTCKRIARLAYKMADNLLIERNAAK